MRLINRVGEVHGRLTVVERAENAGPNDTNARWLCKCECGTHKVVYGQDLKRGKVVSCGCWNQEKRTKHGMASSRIYSIWRVMLDRCKNPNNPSYADYGGRGIAVSEEWKDFETFYADMGSRPKGYSLDRIDNDKGYSKDNCKWSTYRDQLNNRRNNRMLEFRGEVKTFGEWAVVTGIGWHTIRSRIDRYGWSVERALTERP